jgi:hypothetical protein
MRLTGELPPNTVIEVSEVARAFGRRGGGRQIRILDAESQAFTVSELRNQGINRVDSRYPLAGRLATAIRWHHAGTTKIGTAVRPNRMPG